MREHTKGRLVVKGEWLIPEAHADRMIGSSTNKADDKSNYAHTVAIVRGKYQDDKDNARRLAAAWNAFDGVRTEFIEAMAGTGAMQAASDSMSALPAVQAELNAANVRIAKLESLVSERDTMLGKRPCQNSRCSELNVARALLREVSNDGALDMGDTNTAALGARVRSYLDACDKPGVPT